MKKFILIAAASLLVSQLSFAQTEQIDVGVGATQLLRSKAQAYGINASYKSPDGFYFPVSIAFGSDVKKFTAGIGYKTDAEANKLISYSIAAALGHLSFSENLQDIQPQDKERVVALIQQEINFQISKRVGLGVNFDLDVFNGLNQSRHKYITKTAEQYRDRMGFTYNKSTDTWLDDGGYAVPYPAYQTDAEKIASTNSMKQSSGTAFGLSLKIRLGK